MKTFCREFDYDSFTWLGKCQGFLNMCRKKTISNNRWANTSLWGIGNRFPVFYDYILFQLGLGEWNEVHSWTGFHSHDKCNTKVLRQRLNLATKMELNDSDFYFGPIQPRKRVNSKKHFVKVTLVHKPNSIYNL